jgi:hypothetical protein
MSALHDIEDELMPHHKTVEHTDIAPIPVKVVENAEKQTTGDRPERWLPRTYNLVPNIVTQIVTRNRNRRRLIISADTGNTTPVFLGSNNQIGASGSAASQTYALATGAQAPPMEHSDQVYAVATANATLYVWEESFK